MCQEGHTVTSLFPPSGNEGYISNQEDPYQSVKSDKWCPYCMEIPQPLNCYEHADAGKL